MADKSLEAYSKLKGAKNIMQKIRDLVRQNKEFYELDDIAKIN